MVVMITWYWGPWCGGEVVVVMVVVEAWWRCVCGDGRAVVVVVDGWE